VIKMGKDDGYKALIKELKKTREADMFMKFISL
jgi:hypothetical protein